MASLPICLPIEEDEAPSAIEGAAKLSACQNIPDKEARLTRRRLLSFGKPNQGLLARIRSRVGNVIRPKVHVCPVPAGY
jgi:hypothetical protein